MPRSFNSKLVNTISDILNLKSLFYLLKINEYKGRQVLYGNQQAELLEKLQITAITNGAIFSSQIDGISIDRNRFDDLFSELDDPKTREESEIIRYIKVTNIINNHYESINLTPDLLLQFHTNIFNHSKDICGRWKVTNKPIEGRNLSIFKTVSVEEIEEYIGDLCKVYHRESEVEYSIDLVLISLFILDFLCIHPFERGNGRLSRIITGLLLNQHGYYVTKYLSLEEYLVDTKEEYFQSLSESSAGWHESGHDVSLWVEYFLRMVYEGYRKLDGEMFLIKQKKGAKAKQVKQIIEQLGESFTVSEVGSRCFGISRPTINKALQDLRDEGYVRPQSLGRDAVWIKC